MYAVFEDGSRQYRVSEGDVVKVDYRDKSEPGSQVEFERVLLFAAGEDIKIGQPVVDGMRVIAEVIEHPSIKTFIQHFRRRKNYRRLRGHRQHYTSVRIRNILLPGQQPPPAPEKKEEKPPESKPAETKPEAKAETKKPESKPEAKKSESRKGEAKK
jgi:large subunit ribosomal protein L21